VVCVIWQIMQMKKKNRKSADFWKVAQHSGEEVERLIKNLQMEYQKVKQRLHLPQGQGDPTFSRFERIPSCDRQTHRDRQTRDDG